VRPRLSCAVALTGWASRMLLRRPGWHGCAGSPLVLLVLAGVVFWLTGVRRDHCPGISG
jgi:hypothetical protein